MLNNNYIAADISANRLRCINKRRTYSMLMHCGQAADLSATSRQQQR